MSEYGAAVLDLNVTQDFCAFLAKFSLSDLPDDVVHAARRGVLDWIGCALAGSNHPPITVLATVLTAAGGRPLATVFGREVKLGLLDAALLNGQMGHLLDYDDTHKSGVHTSSPTLAALFALSDRGGVTGARFVQAYAAGFEAGVRTAHAAPDHHDGGWHLTGTLGSIAAGAAAGKLLELDQAKMVHALGVAATQAGGMQQNRGTMCKSFHAGKAASNGVLAGLLAESGFDSSTEILEGRKGFCRIYSATAAPEALINAMGEHWEIARNGHKPYACGLYLHPAIDAVIDLCGAAPAEEIDSIDLTVHPKAVAITGVVDPKTGLQSKFSIYHSAAVAFLDGEAGIAQYTDARASASDVAALRRKVTVTTDDSLQSDQARAAVIIASGARREARVAHASGTAANPMSDDAIEAKFIANAGPVIGAARARQIRDLVWRIETLPDMRQMTALCGC